MMRERLAFGIAGIAIGAAAILGIGAIDGDGVPSKQGFKAADVEWRVESYLNSVDLVTSDVREATCEAEYRANDIWVATCTGETWDNDRLDSKWRDIFFMDDDTGEIIER